jgi:hypothetical protein
MSIFKITIQPKQHPNEWPVLVQFQDGDELPIEKNGILQLSEDARQQLSMLRHQPKDYGTFLGKALFRGELFHAFREAFARSQKVMRVLLAVNTEESDGLKTLRWERLCVPIDESWEFLALNQRLPFSQYIPTSNLDRNYPTLHQSDLRALVMVANPENLERYSLVSFDVATIVSGLRQALGDIPCDVLAHNIEDAVGAPTLNQLCQQLCSANPPYTLLHIVCHGRVIEGKTALYLSNEKNQVEPVIDQNLIQRFQHLGSKDSLPHLTFLCSCSSGSPLGKLTQSLVQKLAMPAVVAMADQVSVKTGIALAQGFYPRLRELGAVDIALQQAAAGLAERYDITVPALFSRLGNRPLFEIEDKEMESTGQEKTRSQSGGISFGDHTSIVGDVVAGNQRKESHNTINMMGSSEPALIASPFPPDFLKQELQGLLGQLKSSIKEAAMDEDEKDVAVGQVSSAIQVVKKSDVILAQKQVVKINSYLKGTETILTSLTERDGFSKKALQLLKQIRQLLRN